MCGNLLVEVQFDMSPRKESPVTGAADIEPVAPTKVVSENPEISVQTSPSKQWEIDVRGQISTRKWLATYGLKKNRLDMHHLLPVIGFRHANGDYINLFLSCMNVKLSKITTAFLFFYSNSFVKAL